ncbi:MAG: hypothetical protein JRI68_35730, partial [Deltaproteobacteria bacterium]|nr:hypothetical protein [Deltaproteobacteria bacterium]
MPITRFTLCPLLLLLLPGSALAHGPDEHAGDPDLHTDASLDDCEVHFAPGLTQGAYRSFVREFGSVTAFKQMGGPTTLGQWGIAAGLEYMMFGVEDRSDTWNDTFSHPDEFHELGSSQAYPKLKLRVGVTEDTDVGVFYTMNPRSNYGFIGLDVKHGLLRQSPDMPVSLSLRGAYTKTLFVGDMDMHAVTGDVTLGRTFWSTLTPYAGLGADAVLGRETADTVELETETILAPHAVIGAEVAFWHVALGAETQLAAMTTL